MLSGECEEGGRLSEAGVCVCVCVKAEEGVGQKKGELDVERAPFANLVIRSCSAPHTTYMATDRKRTVLFIGGGNMAYAIIGGLDHSKWHVIVNELVESQRQRLERELGVTTIASLTADAIKV